MRRSMGTVRWLGALGLILAVSGWGCTGMRELREENEALQAEVNRLQQVAEDYKDELDVVKSLSEDEKAALRAEMEQMRGRIRSEMQEQIRRSEALVQRVQDLTVIEIGESALFPSGQAELTPQGRKVIQRIGEVLKRYAGYHVRVEGHTDNVPIGEKLKEIFPSNWELSTARATAVVRYMIYSLNFPPERLSAVGYSKYRPVADNKTPQGRAKNRRIRVVIFKGLPDRQEAP